MYDAMKEPEISVSKVIEQVFIERNKKVDSLIFGEIRKIATENGVETTITLNDKAIVSALKKQVPKRPIIKKSVKVNGFMLRCPNADCEAVLQSDSPCCKYCGQALDWSDTK